MTINSTIRKAGPFIGNGTASSFPFTYKVFQASDLDVVRLDQSTNVETTLVLTTDYTVTLNQDQDSNPGGTVTLVAGALATGYTLTMTSDVPNLQPTDLTNQGGFYPEVINDALDRATIQIQQLQEQTDRSLRLPLSSTADAELPPSAPNELIGWDATGNNLINVDPGSLATVVAYATAYCDVFVGNGVTTSWTLTRNPAVLYNLDVSINGSTQEPTQDYTLSGTTFTMTTPPPIGARVVVKYKEGLPNATADAQDVRYVPVTGPTTNVQTRLRAYEAGGGSDYIGFQRSDPGAITTQSVQDKLRDIISVKDFGAKGDGIADDHAAIQAALDAATYSGSAGKGWAVYLPAGQYLISDTLEIPNATVFFGDGRQQTVIRPYDNTFSGVMITDKGNAGKITLRGFRIEAMGYPGVTTLIKMGYLDQPLGAGIFENIFFSGGLPGVSPLPTCTGIDVVTNVMDFCEIEGGYCGTDFKLGPNSTTSTFDRCYSIGAVYYAFLTNGNTNIVNCEIEAPAATCVPIYVYRECHIQNLTFSQSNNPAITNPYVIRTDPGATVVTVNGLVTFSGGGISTLTTVISDQRSGFPGLWGDPGGQEKQVSSINNNVFTKDFYILNLKRQVFKLRLYTNSGGTMYHKITSQFDTNVPSSFVSKINGATTTGTATPTGTDSSTAMAGGAKISSVSPNVVILDTAQQAYLEWASANASIVLNEFGTALNVSVATIDSNVNGVSRNRIVLTFTNAATGAAFNLATFSTASKVLDVNAEIYIA